MLARQGLWHVLCYKSLSLKYSVVTSHNTWYYNINKNRKENLPRLFSLKILCIRQSSCTFLFSKIQKTSVPCLWIDQSSLHWWLCVLFSFSLPISSCWDQAQQPNGTSESTGLLPSADSNIRSSKPKISTVCSLYSSSCSCILLCLETNLSKQWLLIMMMMMIIMSIMTKIWWQPSCVAYVLFQEFQEWLHSETGNCSC